MAIWKPSHGSAGRIPQLGVDSGQSPNGVANRAMAQNWQANTPERSAWHEEEDQSH